MEPLSALSVAAAVAQFIHFGCSIVSKTKEIHFSTQGTSIRFTELEVATKRILVLNDQLEASRQLNTGGLVEDSPVLEEIHTDCVTIAQNLLDRLNKLKINGDHKNRRWKSFRQALKSVCSKGEIDEMARKLQGHQKELDCHILMSLRQVLNI